MRLRPRGSLVWDRGLASERTVLAWERTAGASLVIAALIVRAGVRHDHLALAVPAAAALVLAAFAEWRHSVRIYAEHDVPLAQGAVVHEGALAAVAAITLVAAAVAGALAVAGA